MSLTLIPSMVQTVVILGIIVYLYLDYRYSEGLGANIVKEVIAELSKPKQAWFNCAVCGSVVHRAEVFEHIQTCWKDDASAETNQGTKEGQGKV